MLAVSRSYARYFAKLRAQMRIELKQLTAKLGITSVYVTHDQEEALSLSDKVVVMDNGEILQQSDPYTVYYRPANTFVGDFMGASNILQVDNVRPAQKEGRTVVEAENGESITCTGSLHSQGPWTVAIKSIHLNLTAEPLVSGTNVWPTEVQSRIFLGDVVEYQLDWHGITLRARELSIHLFEETQPAFPR